MLSAYRAWLEKELKTLGNAAHHAYSFGQANMAKRAVEQLDKALQDSVVLDGLTPERARDALTDLEALGEATPALMALRESLKRALHGVT